LTDPTNIEHASALTAALGSASSHPSPPATQDQPSAIHRPPISDSEEIFDSEFADDPEVSNCLLTPEEVAIKTRIWTHENREYIRKQAAALLKAKLDEENGTGRVIIRRVRKRKRIGDMSHYLGENGEEGTPIARTPAEAVGKMMKRRTYSSKVNYDRIVDAYTPSSSSAGSRRGSESLVGDSPRKEMDTYGQVELTSPGGTTKMLGDGSGKDPEVDVESVAGDRDLDEQQKELESIAGEVEDGIDDSEDDDDADDDPYEGQGGYESD
jgi:transcription factor IIIB subunit 2